MRALALIALLAWGPAWATKYVRPVADCPTNGDGTAYACAASGGATGAWSKMTGVVQSTPAAGETVKTCGNFLAADADTATITLTGNWTNADVVTDGDCLAEGGSARATWDGEGVLARGFDSGSGGAVGAVIRNIDFTGYTAYGIIGQHADSDDWLIEYVGCDGMLMTSQCIRNLSDGATGWTIRNSSFTDCYNDCIFSEEPMVFEDNTAIEWSTGNEIGDFYQHGTGPCDGFVFRRNVLRSTKDIKQGIIINQCSGDADVIFADNEVEKIGGQSSLVDSGFVGLFVDATGGTVTARRNYVAGGRINLFVTGGASLVAEGNVFGSSTTSNVHCGTDTVACSVRHNTISGAGTKAIEMQSAGAGGLAVNNALSGAIGINRAAAGSETGNVIIADDPCYVAGVAGSCDASDDIDNTTMGWVGGDSPTDVDGYCLESGSPLLGVGTYLGAWITGYAGHDLGNPPAIGARGLCLGRAPAASRRAVSGRVAN